MSQFCSYQARLDILIGIEYYSNYPVSINLFNFYLGMLKLTVNHFLKIKKLIKKLIVSLSINTICIQLQLFCLIKIVSL